LLLFKKIVFLLGRLRRSPLCISPYTAAGSSVCSSCAHWCITDFATKTHKLTNPPISHRVTHALVLVVVRYQGVMEALSWLLTLPYRISCAIGQRHVRNAYVTLSIVAGVGVGSSLFLAVLFGAIISLLSKRCEGNDTPDCCGACLDQGALMNSHIFAFTPSRLTILL
jgi:hypothetical protein